MEKILIVTVELKDGAQQTHRMIESSETMILILSLIVRSDFTTQHNTTRMRRTL